MAFLDDACTLLRSRVSSLEEELSQYVPRVLIRGDICPEYATSVRSFYRMFSSSDQQAIEDTELTSLARVAVIGDAGSGKSFVVRRAFLESVQRFLDSPADTPVPFFLDLGQELIANRGIATALAHWCNGLFTRTATEHEPGCVLFLDSLDEKLLKVPDEIEFINAIDLFLRNHRNCLSSVVLACRRAFWNSTWFGSSEPAFEIFHTDHLEYADYFHIIPDEEQRREFFERAESLGIAELLKSPFVGFDLAHTYQRGDPLPSSRREWFERQVGKLLRGRQKDRQRDDAPPLRNLLFLARQLACLATWSTRSSWTIAEAVDQLGEASSLEGGVTRTSVEILLPRPLFRRTDDRFSFSHQLFREHLAAEALVSLPLRKQRQLLVAPEPSLKNRVLMPLRGVAVALAEASPAFADFLLAVDPLVAFLAEATAPSTDYDERLLKTVIDNAIEAGMAYWKSIPPRGDRLDRALHKHCPRDIVSFIRPYLDKPDEMTLLWATACAKAWGGVSELNEALLKLAYHAGQNVEIRKNAIDAILASQCVEDIRKLYGLFGCRDDQVRGHTLVAYRLTENPSPRDYIEKLCGGALDDSLYCVLQREALEYGARLATTSELGEAFRAVDKLYGRLGNLLPMLLGGLVGRALELEFDDVPPSLFVKIWEDPTGSGSRAYRDNLKRILSASPALYARVWHYALTLLEEDDGRRQYWWKADELAEACTDSIFGLLPPDPTALSRGQWQLVHEVLDHHFYREPTTERLRLFRALAPEYTGHLQIPKWAMVRRGRDRLEEASKIAQALNREELTALQRTGLVLSAMGGILHGQERIGWLEPDEVIQFLSELQEPLRRRTIFDFLDCVQELQYSRVEGEKSGTFTMTNSIYAVPFWVLWKLGLPKSISAEKLDEFIRCYAFSGTPTGSDVSAYFPLLDRLQELSPERWEECIFWLIEFPRIGLYGPLQYLIQRESSIYLKECRSRLTECDFVSFDFVPLLDYWRAFHHPDFQQTLRQCYECLGQREDDEQAPAQRFRILWHLLSQDDDWAWEELEKRVEAKTVPTSMHRLEFPASEHLPRDTKRLSAVVNWFTLVRQAQDLTEDWQDDLGRTLLRTIVDIGGEDAIRELERLRRERAFPKAEWLGHSIIDIKDRMLAELGQPVQPSQLLDFVNREATGIVRDERDLFEWVCQAIEDEKASLELGEQVGGYWKGDEPQTEPICQNIIWPAIKRRLSNLGIVGVEERYVGPNKVDLWVVKVGEHDQHLEVFLELKTARKGYGHSKLIDPLKEQLWQKYLKPAAKRFGIYVVLWFKDEDRYPYPTDWATEEFGRELQDNCTSLADKLGICTTCYVIDMTAPIRMH